MIRPKHFGFNEQTAASNSFQKLGWENDFLPKVIGEFNTVVDLLQSKGIEVLVFDDRDDVITPDSIFPNNWISVTNNAIVIYPMLAANRMLERRPDIIEAVEIKAGNVFHKIDLTDFESQQKFLEGTGSIVFDHENKLAYACLSPRTDASLLNELCSQINYEPITFNAFDNDGKPIYHTNVMMAIGSGYAIVCDACIADGLERKMALDKLTTTHHELILITPNQMNSFAGNMLELKNKNSEKLILMSATAHQSLRSDQIESLSKYAELIVCSIPTIENTGGGSIRCMIGELFL